MISTHRLAVFFRRDVVVGVSVMGLALNVIGGLGPLVVLADLAHYIVEHWLAVTAFLWIKLFKLIHVDIPPLLGFTLTMFLFHLGLVTSGLRFGRRDETPERAALEAKRLNRDRLVALLLYLPIMWGTLSTAFAALAKHMASSPQPMSGPVVTLAFCLVVGSPILAFWLARPRVLIRRFISVYVVVTVILALDALARLLDVTGWRQVIKDKT